MKTFNKNIENHLTSRNLRNLALILIITGSLPNIWHNTTIGIAIGTCGILLWFVSQSQKQIKRHNQLQK